MTRARRRGPQGPRGEQNRAAAAVDTPDPHPDWPDGAVRELLMLEHHHPMPEGYVYAPVGLSHHHRYVNWIEPADSMAIAPAEANGTGTAEFR